MPTEVTGLEHVTPVEIEVVSATERASFRGCRRKWFLSIVHRLQSVEGNPNFWLGNLVHAGLETYYQTLKDMGFHADKPSHAAIHAQALEAGLDRYQAEYDREVAVLKSQLGFVWKNVESTWRDLGVVGFEMLQNYFEREEENPLFDEVVAVERRVFVPITAPDGRRSGKLRVRTDVVGRRGGVLAVADHKTASRDANESQLELDDQLTAEVYAEWVTNEEFPEEATYNVLMKKVAEPPRHNQPDKKTGRVKLSKAKDQNTTYELYRAEVEKHGLDVHEYAEILDAYRKRDLDQEESPYFRRYTVVRSPAQMASFEANLYQEWVDMRAVAAHPEKAYPNPTPFSCPSCPVKLICLTMQDDGDVTAIINASYVVGDPRA